MYEININVHKTIKLNANQFALLKSIGQLGFLNFAQITLMWSVINKTYISFSHSTLRQWINNYHLLRKRAVTPSKTKKSSNLSRPVYYLSPVGARMLQKYNTDYIPLSRLNCNSHNEQCNEVTVQALFRAAFDTDLLNNPDQKPLDQKIKHILASPTFNLAKLDLRQFSRQVPYYKKYPFIPDQMIGFNLNGQKCEIMVELDNKTENDNVQIEKIFNYLTYAFDNPAKQILMVIAITDGSLPNYRVPEYRLPYIKINNLLTKFKKSTVTYNHQKLSLTSIYRKVKNLTVVVAGVSEAYVDIADFLSNKDYINFSTIAFTKMAHLLTNRFKHKVVFQKNQMINNKRFNYLDSQGLTLGYIIYNSEPTILQTIKFGYEHSIDTYLDLYSCIPKNYIYSYPIRVRKLLAPAIPAYYKNNPGQSKYSHLQGMVYQPIMEDNINLNWVLHLLFAKKHYYKYLYLFFSTGKISAADNPHNYDTLTYIRSTTYLFLNPYLEKLHIQLKDIPSRSYKVVHAMAKKATSAKEFTQQIHVQDIPTEVITSIMRQIPIRAFSSPYYSTSSSRSDFLPDEYLYLPDQVNPNKRTKISF